MNLNHGRRLTSIPGPSIIPDRVLNAMHVAMPNIYEGELVEVSRSVFDDLPNIARTSGRAYVAICNGHGAWEMSLTNTLSRGDRVLVLESGLFAVGWGEQAQSLGAEVEVLPCNPREPVDPDAVEDCLRADTAGRIKAILVVQVDTASGVWNDIKAIRQAIDAANHSALYMVDAIASLGCERLEMDAWGVDVTVGGSQKGLMVPPGLGLVWANSKAMEAHANAGMRSPYWDWSQRSEEREHYFQYCGTPPVQHVYAMREALDMILEEGLESIWLRHRVLADTVRAAVEAWSTSDGLTFNIRKKAHRSNSTTTILTGSIDAEKLRAICERDSGLTLGIGLGELKGSAFRIGHMGHLNPPTILGTLATIEAALHAMDAPVGDSGVSAASRVIGDALADRPPVTA